MNRQAAIVFNATRQIFGTDYAVKPGSCYAGRRMVLKLEQLGATNQGSVTLTTRPLSSNLQGMTQIVRGENGRLRGISTSLLKQE
jgi:hypothetical protein